MNRPQQRIKIKSIDVAATVQAATGQTPELLFEGGSIATFVFNNSPEVVQSLALYEIGLNVDAKNLLTVRNQLFRRLKGGRQ